MSLGAFNVKAWDILVEFAKMKKFAQYVQQKNLIIEIVLVRETENNRKNALIARKQKDSLIIT